MCSRSPNFIDIIKKLVDEDESCIFNWAIKVGLTFSLKIALSIWVNQMGYPSNVVRMSSPFRSIWAARCSLLGVVSNLYFDVFIDRVQEFLFFSFFLLKSVEFKVFFLQWKFMPCIFFPLSFQYLFVPQLLINSRKFLVAKKLWFLWPSASGCSFTINCITKLPL